MCGKKWCTISYVGYYRALETRNCEDEYPDYDKIRFESGISFINCPNMKFVPEHNLTQLSELTVTDCVKFNFGVLARIAPVLTRLKVINSTIAFNIERFRYLRTLSLDYCTGIRRITRNPSLTTVILHMCINVDTIYGNRITHLAKTISANETLQEQLMGRILFGGQSEQPPNDWVARKPGIIVDRLRMLLESARRRIVAQHVNNTKFLTVVLCVLVGEYVM